MIITRGGLQLIRNSVYLCRCKSLCTASIGTKFSIYSCRQLSYTQTIPQANIVEETSCGGSYHRNTGRTACRVGLGRRFGRKLFF